MSLEEKFEALMKSYQTVTSFNSELKNTNREMTQRMEEMVNQNAHLRKQLKKSMKQKQRLLESPTGSNPKELSEEAKSQHSEYEVEVEPRRTPCREWRALTNSTDFRVELLEFEGKLDPNELLEWLHTVEQIFEYKEVPEDKKVKLVALRLYKYASLWWTNLCNKKD